MERTPDKQRAIFFAERALDDPREDPDDDLRTVSRQFLRALERLGEYEPPPAEE